MHINTGGMIDICMWREFYILIISLSATNLCFAEKTIYTQEVLAVVLQQLLEQTPIPTLFMRTVSYTCTP